MSCLRQVPAWLVIVLFFWSGLSLGVASLDAQEPFLRGDVNVDGRLSVSDALMTRHHLFLGRAVPCRNAADVDDSGRVDITDEISALAYLFEGGSPPPPPYPEVGVDPTPNEGTGGRKPDCESYEVVDPESTDDVVELGDVSGGPGDDVEVSVFVQSDRDIEAVQLVVSYDPDVFVPEEGGLTLVYNGTHYAPFVEEAEENPGRAGNFRPYSVVSAHPEAGIFVVGFISDLGNHPEYSFPAGTAAPIFKLPGTIAATAPPGATVELTPTNGEDGEGFGPAAMENELTHEGGARLVATLPELEGAVLQIVGDQVFFRGDADGDGEVALTDAVFTLHYLFLGEMEPPCLDAADSNDDGRINITDPVKTLHHLFGNVTALPPPFSAPGWDPTPDGIDCNGA